MTDDVLFQQTKNDNFLSPLGARFWIRKIPNTNYFCQEASIPGLSLGPAIAHNPFVQIPYPGDHLEYNELPLEFKVDEDMQNYLELHRWIRALGKPDNFGEYATLAQVPLYTGLGLISDAVLLIMDAKRNINYEFTFESCWPLSLSNLDFTQTAEDVEYITARVEFAYIKFEITSTKAGDAANYVPAWPEENSTTLPGKSFYKHIAPAVVGSYGS